MTKAGKPGAPKKREPIHPHYGDGRFLVAVLNHGGSSVPTSVIVAELATSRTYDLSRALARVVQRGLLAVRPGKHDLLYTLTEAGRKRAIIESPDVDTWVKRYEAGEYVREIAKHEYGKYDHEVVFRALTARGVRIRNRREVWENVRRRNGR